MSRRLARAAIRVIDEYLDPIVKEGKPMTTDAGLAIDLEDGIATVTICQPERKNALTKPMWAELSRMIADLSAREDLRCVVIRGGAGAGFGAGADIHEFVRERRGFNKARDYGLLHAEALQNIQSCQHPVIAAIDGVCVGASMVLAAACDFRIAADDTRFMMPPMKLGATLGYPELQILLDVLGRATLMEVLFEGQMFDAARALQVGFVSHVVTLENFENEIENVASRISRGAPISQRMHKKMINRLVEGGTISPREFDDGYLAFDSDDFEEGYSAFLEKRKPLFQGR